MKFKASAVAMLLVLASFAVPGACLAQVVDAADREALVKMRTARGGQAAEVDALIRLANDAAAKGLPAAPLTNKIREGLAKGHDPKLIEVVVRQLSGHLETADRLMREMDPAAGTGRGASVILLAEAIGSGVTPDEVREMRRAGQSSGKPLLMAEGIAGAARGLSHIKEAKLPVPDGNAVITEAVRQGFRSHEILDLGREIKRRESEYRTGRSSLRTLRDAIARGDRPDQLFRDSRPPTVERPAAARPEPVVERPARPESRPEPRPEPPTRPDRPREF